MTGATSMLTGTTSMWIWIGIILSCIGGYYLYKQGKMPWLKVKGINIPSIKMPGLFQPRPEDLTRRLKVATEKEVARTKELNSVLEAKRELAKARAENIKLMREIDGVSARNVEKASRDEQKAQRIEQEAQKVKPKRL